MCFIRVIKARWQPRGNNFRDFQNQYGRALNWGKITSYLDLTKEPDRKLFHWILRSDKGIDVICFASIIEKQDYSKKVTNKWAKYLKDFWRYGQLHANFSTLKVGLAAILDHMILK